MIPDLQPEESDIPTAKKRRLVVTDLECAATHLRDAAFEAAKTYSDLTVEHRPGWGW